MNGWSDYLVKQEQYKDLLREAEKQRLIRQMTADCEKPTVWQAIRGLVLGITKSQPARDEVPCGEYTRLAEKAA